MDRDGISLEGCARTEERFGVGVVGRSDVTAFGVQDD